MIKSLGIIFVVLLSGCSSMPSTSSLSKTFLPQSSVQTQGWQTFDDAKTAVESITPYKTTKADLVKLDIGHETDAKITLLSHVDIAARFPAAGFENSKIDQGVHECLQAGKRCTGYLVNVRKVENMRTGDFFLDVFRFKQTTETSGWSFNAYIFFVDDVVVYVVYGGQPKIFEMTTNRNPLGPIQNFGDWASGKVIP